MDTGDINLKNKLIKAVYIQEFLSSYREPLVEALANEYDLTVLSGSSHKNSGFKVISPKNAKLINAPTKYIFKKRLSFQKNILSHIVKNRPDFILTAASTRNVTYWLLLVISKLTGVKVFSHGQGLFSKPHPNNIVRIGYKIISSLTYKYICYSQLSEKSLLNVNFDYNKIIVAENSISCTPNAEHLNKNGHENGILFIGRLRQNCNIENLIMAVERLRADGKDIVLHIIGSGELESHYRSKYKFEWLKFHGAIYDNNEIYNISKICRYGCYPGDAGLSIVHYFSLKLPPIIHSNIYQHMGPEPSYVIEGVNGLTFNRDGGVESIYLAIKNAWSLPSKSYLNLVNNAFSEYQRLNNPPLEYRIISSINDSIK